MASEDLTVQALEDEEEAIAAKNETEDDKLLSDLKVRHRQEAEERHAKLMKLLDKSQFYSQYVLQNIQDTSKTLPEKKCRRGSKGGKENLQSRSSSRCNKRKVLENSQSNSQSPKRQKLMTMDDEEPQSCRSSSSSQNSEESRREGHPKLFENGCMRSYQVEGFSWLKVLFENGVNGILADEMGLGKTIQTIALICYLIEMNVVGPFLIIAPLSTLPNWMLEFKRFAPKVPLLLYHGPESVRKEKQRMFYKRNNIDGMDVHCFPIVITSYEVVIRDSRKLKGFLWRYIVVDEGHRLKNHKCRLTRCLNSFNSTSRLLLTGTPLQNNLAELWSLLNFLVPEIFDCLEIFESWFDIEEMMDKDSEKKILQQEREKQILSTLHKILLPFLLRRVKSDVDLLIPPKRELLVYTPMTPLQIRLYTASLKRDFESMREKPKKELNVVYNSSGRPIRQDKSRIDISVMFDKSNSDESFNRFFEASVEKTPGKKIKENRTFYENIKMQNIMMQLRKIVNHPYLMSYPLDRNEEFKVDEELLKHSGKLQVLDQLLNKLYARGHRVLVFSQMTKMLDIMEDYLTLRPQYRYKRLDGSCSLDVRTSDIEEFNADDSYFLFLLSTRAGGLGINLTAADTVIIYDSDWNPQQDLQAQDRCHRIGQTKPVLVLRLVTTNTIDQRIVERAQTKRKLEKIIMKAGKFKSGSVQEKVEVLDPAELLELLHQTDYHQIHETSTGNVFSKEELDCLLDRKEFSRWNIDSSTDEEKLTGVFKVLKNEL